MRVARFLPAVLPLAVLIAALATACGGGGEPASEPSPGATSPVPIPTISVTLELTPTVIRLPLEPRVTPTASLDLASITPLLTVFAPEPMDIQTGISTVATGDFDGDGVSDLLIGLPFADGPDNSREDAGEAMVIFGRSDLEGEIDLADAKVGLHVLGAVGGDNLGSGLAGGDLNGDGIDDIVVGAPGSNGLPNIRTDLGEAYVILGRSDLGGTVDILNVEQDATFRAAEGFARLGGSFAIADVNGDGTADLVAGAPFAGREPRTSPGGPRTTVGEVYVFFGSTEISDASVARDEQDFTVKGANKLDAFGLSVAAGDLNGDGIADIVIGARGFDVPGGARDSGAVFVFFGSRDLPESRVLNEADFTVLGADVDDGFGQALASGDFNGDGLADFVAVARTGDGAGNARRDSGEAHVVFGTDSLSGTLDLSSETADASVYGVDVASLMATAVTVGDLDGDGRDDVVLGTPTATGNELNLSGAAYVVYGKGLVGQVDLRYDVEGQLYIFGAAEGDGLGTGAVIGDVNADGRRELIVAAGVIQGGERRRGIIYVLELP